MVIDFIIVDTHNLSFQRWNEGSSVRLNLSEDSASQSECSSKQQLHDKEINDSLGEKSFASKENETKPPENSDRLPAKKSEIHLTPSALRKRKLRNKPGVREKEQKHDTAKRRDKRNEPGVREKEQEHDTAKRRDKRDEPGVREKEVDRRRDKRDEPGVRKKEQKRNTTKKREKSKTSKHSRTSQERIKLFRKVVSHGCNFICVCCHKRNFKTNVQIYTEKFKADVKKKNPDALKKSIPEPLIEKDKHMKNHYLCKACVNQLRKGNTPPQSVLNGLKIVDLKDKHGNEIKLSELEATCIAKEILFTKIYQLPRSRWSAMKDRTICIPITDNSIVKTIKSFPRTLSESAVIPLKLKRKLSFKQHHLHQFIRPTAVINALHAMKDMGNRHYAGVEIDENYVEKCRSQDDQDACELLMDDATENERADSAEAESAEQTNEKESPDTEEEIAEVDAADKAESHYLENDSVRKWQYNLQNTVMMGDMFPENSVRNDDEPDKPISIAPGEGMIPKNILSEKHWDEKAFPTLHPDGQFGFDHKRETKLSAQDYFKTRILGKDTRFNTPAYVMGAVNYLDQGRLESNKNLSYRHGKCKDNPDGTKVYNLEDSYTVLSKIPNTPKYWQEKKQDLIAKIYNLGPFPIFFTLSCAERRWLENIDTLIREKLGDVDITFKFYSDRVSTGNGDEHEENTDDSSIREEQIFIEGVPMEEYLKENNIEWNEHDEMRQHVLTLTRNFDHRLKAFVNNIIMGQNSDMKVDYYSYRIEFQGRGAPHAHGVLWLDLEAKERDEEGKIRYEMDENGISQPIYLYPGVKNAMSKIKDDLPLEEVDIQSLESFTDKFVTCDIHDAQTSHIVKEVNKHHCTKTCHAKAKGSDCKCRFGFAKLPAKKTTIAVPYRFMDLENEKGEQISDEEKKGIFNGLQKTLQKVQKFVDDDKEMEKLEHLSIDEQITELCKLAKVTVQDYESALGVSNKQYKIVLKRKIEERYINNYNKEWILAWNGNMDIQVCLDFFGVVTYISEYVTKMDAELMNSLTLAAKHCKSKSTREQMETIAYTFLKSRCLGESEVYYRLLPELHFTHSNIQTKYLPAGFPESRSKMMYVVEKEEEKLYDQDQLVEIEGKPKKYTQKATLISKYIRRPPKLEEMSYLQFAKMYESKNKVGTTMHNRCSKELAEPTEDLEKHHQRSKDFHKIIIKHDNRDDMSVDEYKSMLLPRYIELSDPLPGEPKNMSLRNHPFAIKQYVLSKEKQEHEYLYSELLFYRPFRDEKELHQNNRERCAQLYVEKEEFQEQTKLQRVKSIVMAHQESVREGREKAEIILNDITGENLDPEFEQEQNEAKMEGMHEHPDYPELVPPENPDNEDVPTKTYFKKIELIPEDNLYSDMRKLDDEQQLAVQMALQFAKKVKKHKNGSITRLPEPLKLIIHGGAGAGNNDDIFAQNLIIIIHI